MHRPSAPRLPAATVPASPRPREVELEAIKERERKLMGRRKGYMSTIMTRGGVGTARTQKAKVLGE